MRLNLQEEADGLASLTGAGGWGLWLCFADWGRTVVAYEWEARVRLSKIRGASYYRVSVVAGAQKTGWASASSDIA